MNIRQSLQKRAHDLEPGCFAAVMATGVVSIDASQHGMMLVAQGLLVINVLTFVWLLSLSTLRLLRFRDALIADLTDPSRGAGFLTLVAAICVLGSQLVLVMDAPMAARLLAGAGATTWFGLIYAFFVAMITRRMKPNFTRSINGGWLIVVVATQAVAVLAALIAAPAAGAPESVALLFAAVCLYLLGGGLYLLIITLVVYRMVFFSMRAREFTPPYWINMGALAITTLAGSLFILHAPEGGSFGALLPFVKGFTLFFWAMATWWIPLLLILEIWRHGWRHVPLRYEADDWDIVFPIGMYTVGTFELARALQFDFLQVIPAVGVYVSLLAWFVVASGMLMRLRQR